MRRALQRQTVRPSGAGPGRARAGHLRDALGAGESLRLAARRPDTCATAARPSRENPEGAGRADVIEETEGAGRADVIEEHARRRSGLPHVKTQI